LTTSDQFPEIHGLAKKLRFLERRRDNLEERVTEHRGTEGSLTFDRAEIAALDAALDAMRYHWAVISRLDTPLSALRSLIDAVGAGKRGEIANAVALGIDVLSEFDC
jgi:hypothetical protein